MSFPRYPKYRDSGVEWLGDIPGHWEVWKLAHACKDIGSGTTPKSDNPAYYDDGTTPWLNTGDLNDGELYGCDKNVTALAFDEHSSLRLYPENSVAIAMYGATIGKLAILRFATTVNQACCVFGESQRVSTKFLFYWLFGLRQQIISLATGGGQPNISQDILRSLRLACPYLDEQHQIVTLLDRETAKIDALIFEQEKLITLLAEKRQATISHAVTKGLNPNVPMKDSGVEWLGDVPEHWRVVPLMRLTHPLRPIMYGIVLPGVSVESGIPIVKGGDVKPARLKVELLNRTTKEIELPFARARLRPLDIVYSIRGTIGDAEVVPDELLDANITQDVARISPASGVQTSWLIHVMKSKPIFVQLAQRSLGAAVPGINIRELKRAMIPVPPAEERAELATFLDAEIGRLKALANEAARGITLLKERRSALISAAVTGKIDVRQAVQQEQITIQEAA